jgi:hypothetical protein
MNASGGRSLRAAVILLLVMSYLAFPPVAAQAAVWSGSAAGGQDARPIDSTASTNIRAVATQGRSTPRRVSPSSASPNPPRLAATKGTSAAGRDALGRFTGAGVDDLAAGLKSGAIEPGDVPAIRVVERDGDLFTLDNRRLEAFRRAGVPIRYRYATPEEAANEAFKFTTRNGGQSVRVRGG